MLRRLSCVVLVLGALLSLPAAAAAHDPEEGAHDHPPTGGVGVPDLHTPNMRLLANLPKPVASRVSGSDLAFWGDRAYAGNYDGFRIIDVAEPANPRVLADVSCPAPQNDISVYRNELVFLSVDAPQTRRECENSRTTTWAATPDAFEGIRIFDVRDPRNPQFVAAVPTDCGSHTHTLVPDPGEGRVLIYVSSYALSGASIGPDCPLPAGGRPSHGKISVIEVPLDEPRLAEVINEPELDPATRPCTPTQSSDTTVDPREASFICDREDDATSPLSSTGCHDIQVFLEIDRAACSALAEGQLWDISDREQPRLVKRFDNPNFEFWHNAVFTWDGRVVVFSDEAGGGGEPWCRPGDPDTVGANWFYRVDGPSAEPLGHYKIPRTTTGSCTAHNGNIVPVRGRYLYVQGWYTGGTSVSDFTDPARPREVAFYNAQDPVGARTWSSYWYRGWIFANDINRGFDTLMWRDSARRGARRAPYYNPQTQVSLLR